MNRVLIIAEKESYGTLISEILGLEGYSGTAVESFNLALFELAQNRYHAVILTNTSITPDQIRYLIQEIKTKYSALKIIVISGYTNQNVINDLEKHGVDYFFPLPFACEDFRAIIRQKL